MAKSIASTIVIDDAYRAVSFVPGIALQPRFARPPLQQPEPELQVFEQRSPGRDLSVQAILHIACRVCAVLIPCRAVLV